MTEFENAKIDENNTECSRENTADHRPENEIMEEGSEKDCRRRHRGGCHRPEGRPGHGCHQPEGFGGPEGPRCHRPEGFGGPEGPRCHRPEGFSGPEGPHRPEGPFFPGHGPMGRPFPPMPDPDSLMGLWIRSHRALERRPADHRGVRRVLRLLDLGGGNLSQRELMELMAVQPGSLSELLSKMEARGLITRTRSEEDHRRVTVSLTEAGKEKAAERGPRDIFSALSNDEKEQLRSLLAKLTAAWEDRTK